MAFPVRVHELRIRMQNQERGFDLVLDPELVQTLVVYWRETESGIQPGAEVIREDLPPEELARVPGVQEVVWVTPDAIAYDELMAKVPTPCWHDDRCIWHCLDRLRGDYIAVNVTCVYSSRHRTYRTVVDAAFTDRIVYRNFKAEDVSFRLPARVVEIAPAEELMPGKDGVISHQRQELAESASGEFTWHDPRCIWHQPE
jgi:hypothetical protein